MKYLITGSSGFIGAWLSKELKGQYTGYDIVPSEWTHRVIDLYGRNTARLAKDVKAQVLYYTAANAREGASQFQPASITRNNLSAYVNTLEGFINGGGQKVILFSSMAGYGDRKPPFDESLPFMPVDIYGWNKYAMEEITKILCDIHGLSYVIIRPHNVFGPGQNLRDKFRNVFGIWMNQIMRGDPITIFGDGLQTRAFSFIEDSLPAYLQAEQLENETVNIGGMVPLTINKVAWWVMEDFSEYSPTISYHPDRPLEVKHAHCTWDKSQKLLCYNDTVGVREGLRQMAKWAKEQGPKKWIDDKLTIYSSKAPKHWYPPRNT